MTLFKSHNPNYPDGGQLRDFVYVKDAAAVVAWLLTHDGADRVFNLGTGRARSFQDLAEATFRAAGYAPNIAYVETPEAIRANYQYFTEADTRGLTAAGYDRPFASLEDGVADYVAGYLAKDDPYR